MYVCICVYATCVWVPLETRKECQNPWNWIPGSCQLPNVGNYNELGSSERAQLTLTDELSFQPPRYYVFIYLF